jgi:hypothetical protein
MFNDLIKIDHELQRLHSYDERQVYSYRKQKMKTIMKISELILYKETSIYIEVISSSSSIE